MPSQRRAAESTYVHCSGIEAPARLALAHSEAMDAEIPHRAACRPLVDASILDLREIHDHTRDPSPTADAQRRQLRHELLIEEFDMLHGLSIQPDISSPAFAP